MSMWLSSGLSHSCEAETQYKTNEKCAPNEGRPKHTQNSWISTSGAKVPLRSSPLTYLLTYLPTYLPTYLRTYLLSTRQTWNIANKSTSDVKYSDSIHVRCGYKTGQGGYFHVRRRLTSTSSSSSSSSSSSDSNSKWCGLTTEDNTEQRAYQLLLPLLFP